MRFTLLSKIRGRRSRPRESRLQSGRMLAAGAAAVLTAAALLQLPGGLSVPGPATTAAAHATDQTTSAGQEANQTHAEMIVAPTTPVWQSGQTHTLSVLLRAAADTAIPEGKLVLHLASSAPDDGTEIAKLPVLLSHSVDRVEKGAEHEFELKVPAGELLGASRDSGTVYLVAQLETADDADSAADSYSTTPLTASAPVLWHNPARDAAASSEQAADDAAAEQGTSGQATAGQDGDTQVPSEAPPSAAQLQFATIVPITLPATGEVVPTAAELDSRVADWQGLLDAATQANATLAIDPRVIAGLRLLSDDASKQATELLQQLEHTKLQNFLLQYADADIAAQAQLGFTTLLSPTNVYYAGGSSADLATVFAWQPTMQAVWPAEDAVDESVLRLAHSSGYQTVVLGSGNVASKTSGVAQLAGSALTAVVSNDAQQQLFDSALTAETATERARATAELVASLRSAWEAGTPQVLALPRTAVAEQGDSAATLLTLLTKLDWLSPTQITALTPSSTTLTPQHSGEQRLDLLRAASKRERTVNERGVLLSSPALLSGYQRLRLLTLFSTQAVSDNFEEFAQNFQKEDAKLISGVQAVSTPNTQLLGQNVKVPVQVRNSLPFTAEVQLTVRTTNAMISVEKRQIELTVPGGSTVSALVPVQGRVTSGESGIIVEVASKDGRFTSNTATLPLTLSSDVERIGVIVVSVLACLLLGFGIVRSVRRKRGQTADVA